MLIVEYIMACVKYQGRMVSAHWYNRYVRGKPVRPHVQPERIIAALYLPSIGASDPAETRLVDLNRKPDLRWVQEIAECYAAPPAGELTSFFPHHP